MIPFRERNPVLVGAASLIVLALIMLAAFRAQSLPLIGGGTTYHAMFTESGGLEKGNEVRMAGVRVGKVEDVALDEEKGQVKVTFRIETDARFGTETHADIKIKTLLGQMFLSLEPEGPDQLEDDGTIPVSRTTSPFDVVEAFSGLAQTSEDIDTDQLAKSLTTLADLTRNTPEEFQAALSGVSALSTNIAARDTQINTLLDSLTRVSKVLDARDEDIIALMDDADVLFQALVSRRDSIHRILVSTSTLSNELTSLVRQSRADLKPALTRLQSVVAVLNKNEDNLDNGLRLLAPFVRVFTNTLGTGPWFDTFIFNLPPVPTLPGVGR